jgi:hypothetical protein
MANTFKFGNGEWAVGKETALAYNDENSNFKPLPFTFDRASTATVVNKDGLIETVGTDEPRIDFLNNTKGHLLLEPQRTNSFLQSNNFNTSWSVSNATLTGGQSGVGGSNDAWLFTASSGTNEKKIFQSSPLSGNVAVSVYAKKGTNNYLWFRGVTSGFAIRTWFNLSTGQVATDNAVSSEMVDMGNGWYRCIAIFNQDAGWDFHIGNSNQDNQVSVNTTGTIYIQYAQSEEGSYATSYIPTSGQSGGVTRSLETMPDYLDITPLNIGNSYTLFLDANLNVNENNKVFLQLVTSSSTTSFTVRNNVGGVRAYNQLDSNYPVSGIISSSNKFVIRVDGNSYKIFVKGSSLSGTLTTQRDLGKLNFIGNNTELKINNFTIDNTALSDAECQALVN